MQRSGGVAEQGNVSRKIVRGLKHVGKPADWEASEEPQLTTRSERTSTLSDLQANSLELALKVFQVAPSKTENQSQVQENFPVEILHGAKR